MKDEIRRSITRQILREKDDLENKIRNEFSTKISHLQCQINNYAQAINTLTDKLMQLAIEDNRRYLDDLKKKELSSE